ncbi:hypothetical protein GF362_01720 [Candidatus Dojkabacteria bacterium]|nr:hypothetical protein [Candidatus Dojkabacteria bacterium]
MPNFNKLNRTFKQITRNNKNFSSIAKKDYSLFQKFFEKEKQTTYGNSWTYITQGMYGIGESNLGYKYYDGENLSAVCIYPKIENPKVNVFYWIRPMGKNVFKEIKKFSNKILKEEEIPTSVTKIFKNEYNSLINAGFKSSKEFPWHSTAHAEDDTYPEIITDIQSTLINKKNRKSTRKALKVFDKLKDQIQIKKITTQQDQKIAWKIVKEFFSQNIETLSSNLSNPYDYYNIIFNTAPKKETLYLLQYNNFPAGIFDIYRMSDSTACTYMSLMLREHISNLDDFATIYTCKKLFKEDYQYLNVGGSETKGLHQFKLKLHTYKKQRMYWAVLF